MQKKPLHYGVHLHEAVPWQFPHRLYLDSISLGMAEGANVKAVAELCHFALLQILTAGSSSLCIPL